MRNTQRSKFTFIQREERNQRDIGIHICLLGKHRIDVWTRDVVRMRVCENMQHTNYFFQVHKHACLLPGLETD